MSIASGKAQVRIGLEVHLQVDEPCKLFSGELWQNTQAPNQQISAVTLGLPGAIPALNANVVTKGLILANRIGGAIACELTFDRKHYTYPDLPKGYQITQQRTPLSVGGIFPYLIGHVQKMASIQQVHLEEDAAKTIHKPSALWLDYNRAGAPLIELVTEPCFSSGKEATAFLQQLQMWVRQADISAARMEDGGMRCDVNVSLKCENERSEIKNLNSFSELRRAADILAEELKTRNEAYMGHTVKYDSIAKKLVSMREKEQSANYRFLPEFDIPTVPTRFFYSSQVPDYAAYPFPATKVVDLSEKYQMSTDEAWFFVQHEWAEDLLHQLTDKSIMSEGIKLICGPLAALWKDLDKIPNLDENWVAELERLLHMIKEAKVSRDVAYRRVLPVLVKRKLLSVEEFVKQEGWLLNNKKRQLSLLVNRMLDEYPAERDRLFAGERQLIGFFIGCIRDYSNYTANPKLVNEILQDKLKGI